MIANFNMPEFYMGKDIYKILFKLQKQHPEIFYLNTNISTIFGNFPGVIWNGGTVQYTGSISIQEIRDIISFYNEELNIPLRFTFTNPLLHEFHCLDTYSNLIVQAAHNGKNQILVVNPFLEQYLRKTYPNYIYCRSILAAETIYYELNGRYGQYAFSVLKRIMNNNWEYLNTIPSIDRPKIELLCNDPCPDNCPRIYTHYKDFAYTQLTFGNESEKCNCTMIELKSDFPIYNTKHNLKTYISREMIDKQYLPQGFCEFKCSGRWSILKTIEAIINYLIQPQYHDDVMHIMISHYIP